MLRSRLSFCTAMSMRESTPLPSASAVFSMSSAHRWPVLCIPARHSSSSNLISTSRLNWSYFVNTAITGTVQGPISQPQFLELHLDVPSLFGQISLKYFISRPGRSLSIGMQYLEKKACGLATVDTQREQTISRAIYPPSVSPIPSNEQSFAQSAVHLYLRLQI